jgi:hypothetical protein
MNSTRRFIARPPSGSFGAIGRASPSALTVRFFGKTIHPHPIGRNNAL